MTRVVASRGLARYWRLAPPLQRLTKMTHPAPAVSSQAAYMLGQAVERYEADVLHPIAPHPVVRGSRG